jgi:hypothetical protein
MLCGKKTEHDNPGGEGDGPRGRDLRQARAQRGTDRVQGKNQNRQHDAYRYGGGSFPVAAKALHADAPRHTRGKPIIRDGGKGLRKELVQIVHDTTTPRPSITESLSRPRLM